MAQYLITYFGGNPLSTPEEGQAHFAKYKQWLAAMGEQVVSPANPLKNTHTIDSDGVATAGSATSMSGYTIVQTESLEQALVLAKSCPFLDIGGTLEVAEMVQMTL